MTFSVIIPTKDRPIDLPRTVGSIVNQTILPDELIIVDASSDRILSENQKKCEQIIDGKIKLLYLWSKPGVNTQRNLGADNASGEIIFFQDDDAVLNKDCYEKMLEVYELKKDLNLGGVQGTIQNYYGLSKFHNLFRKLFFLTRMSVYEKSRFLPSMGYVFIPFPKEIIEVEAMTTLFCSYYRKVFNEFRFDESFSRCTDLEISYRVSRKYRLYQTPCALVTHQHTEATHINIRVRNKLYVIHMHKLMKKHMPRKLSNRLAYCWSLAGQFILDTVKSCVLLNPDSFLGQLEGLKCIMFRQYK